MVGWWATFIRGGISFINPVDMASIRVPGAELKEALLPEEIVWGRRGLTENISVKDL